MKILESLENVREFISQLNDIMESNNEWEHKYDIKEILYKDAFARWQFYMKGYKKLGGKEQYGTV